MKPDKENILKLSPQSYWIDSTKDMTPEYPALAEDTRTDVVIVGGGIAGITCAYLLGKEGLSVAVLEADRVARGTTGRTTAKITSQHNLIYHKLIDKMGVEMAQQYATANETAIREIKALTESLKIDCELVPQSAFVFTESDEYMQELHDETDAALNLGIKAAYVDSIPFPFTIKGAVRFDNQAQFHPLKYTLSLAKAFAAGGGKIFEKTRAVEVDYTEGYTITTQLGKKITADNLIIASHYPFYNKHGAYFTRIYQERSYVTAIKTAEQYPGGMYINAEKPARSLRSQKTGDGELILVGGAHHKTGQCDNTWGKYVELFNFANPLFTIADIPYRWSAQDCMTLDSVPYVGNFTKDTPNLYVATGFGKWGMTNSMASAMLLRDLIIKGDSPWKDVYSPSRSTKAASAITFVTENLNVAKELIGGKMETLAKVEDIKLPNGEGKAVELNGKKAGAYRNDEGILYIVNTTCTHMGCELSWNSAERTWDCPCHGSRFSYEGKIIEGPATKELDLDYDVNTVGKLLTEDY
jgi:glycine/D-amino acid oxidase-like deaminating enzyme/nitrite reductase/ring-hydroxylating ferredoxin subunit